MRIKLPKQWRNWCADQHLKPQGKRTRRNSDWFYLIGRGHRWRVNCFAQFERGDTYADFDRWALCEIVECPMPTTREAFRCAVANLLKGQ